MQTASASICVKFVRKKFVGEIMAFALELELVVGVGGDPGRVVEIPVLLTFMAVS